MGRVSVAGCSRPENGGMLHMVTWLAVAAAIALAVAGVRPTRWASSSQAAGRPVGSSSLCDSAAEAPASTIAYPRSTPGPAAGYAGHASASHCASTCGSMRATTAHRFGPAWGDVDGGTARDTRNDILNRDSYRQGVGRRLRTCEVRRGVLRDPYRGRLIHFRPSTLFC